ncbi:unnamed protein product [Brassica oleracea]|uniref:(rape) hypothetical protein n=1 Tax=Brassica napus TaxID=3708 RepID=A0A816RPK4_BRANA|nr:unnamed protein product [Brassica napus]
MFQKAKELPLLTKRMVWHIMDQDTTNLYFSEVHIFAMLISTLYTAFEFNFIPTASLSPPDSPPGNSIVVMNNSVSGFAVDGILVTEPDLFPSSQILPWQGLKAGTKKQKYDVVSEKKVSTPIEVLCKNCPSEFVSYFHYRRSLVKNFFSLEDVMEEVGLGPNGALMYCMEKCDTHKSCVMGTVHVGKRTGLPMFNLIKTVPQSFELLGPSLHQTDS